MDAIREWVLARWQDTLVPVAVFLASLVVLAWVRRLLGRGLGRWVRHTQWPGDDIVFGALRRPSLLWVVLIASYLGLQASQVSGNLKVSIGRGLWTLLVFSVALFLTWAATGLLQFYGERLRVPGHVTRGASIATTILVLLVALLMVLDLWGAPVVPLLLALGLVAIAAGIALRDVLPNLLASLHINATGQIKVGDYIRLKTGEEGYVEEVGWGNTRIRGPDQSVVLVPNAALARTTVVNYGRPLKKAREPFRFYSRTHLKELTGLKARDLSELAQILKRVPESVVYYHTHHFLEEHHYLRPEPPNDFAGWVTDVLGEEALGERLAAVDTFEFSTLGALRERLVGVLNEHLAAASDHRTASEGREFHFIKSVNFVTPTAYIAHDLRELVEVLRKLPLGSLYFHIFESRIRLGRSGNDFSIWVGESLGEEQMADEIARLDVYQHTLEELRSLLIRLVEKRIK